MLDSIILRLDVHCASFAYIPAIHEFGELSKLVCVKITLHTTTPVSGEGTGGPRGVRPHPPQFLDQSKSSVVTKAATTVVVFLNQSKFIKMNGNQSKAIKIVGRDNGRDRSRSF